MQCHITVRVHLPHRLEMVVYSLHEERNRVMFRGEGGQSYQEAITYSSVKRHATSHASNTLWEHLRQGVSARLEV